MTDHIFSNLDLCTLFLYLCANKFDFISDWDAIKDYAKKRTSYKAHICVKKAHKEQFDGLR